MGIVMSLNDLSNYERMIRKQLTRAEIIRSET